MSDIKHDSLCLEAVLVVQKGYKMSQDEKNSKATDDNVVQMPVQNMKRVLHKEFLSQKRNALLGSFIVFLAIFGFVNHVVWQDPSNVVTGRGVASTGAQFQRTYDKEFEQEMLQHLQEASDVSMGRGPNSLDQFKYGELKGEYKFKLKNGKVLSLELSEAISRANAKYKKSSLDFLLTHSRHLPVEYSQVDKIESEIEDGVTKEAFALKKDGKEVGKAIFTHNQDGGLVSFSVE